MLACVAIAAAISLPRPAVSSRPRNSQPGTDRLARYDLSYQMSSRIPPGTAAAGGAHGAMAISLTPSATVGLSLFLSFAIFMLGAVRIVSALSAGGHARW